MAALGPEVTVEMKNALLSVKLDNKMTFEPAEVLKEFEELNITPNKVMRELTNKNLKIPLRNAFEVVIGLVQGGHASSISQVLEIVNPSEQLREQQFQRRQQMHVNRFATRQRTFDYHDTMNCVLELLSMNCCEGAVDLLKYAINNVLLSDSEEKLALGLRSVVMELLRKGVGPRTDCIRCPQTAEDRGLSSSVITSGLHSLRQPIRRMLTASVYRLTDFLLKTVHTEPGSMQKTVFNWSLMPLVEKCAQDYPDVLKRYKEIDVPKSMREMFEVACLLQRGAFTEARNLIESGYKYAGHLVQNALSEGWINSGFKSRELVDLLKTLNLRSVAPMKTNSMMLLKLLKTNHNNLTAEHFNDLIACWVDADLKLLPRYTHPLKVEAGKRGVTVENVKRLTDQITSSQFSMGFDSPITKDLNSKDYLQPLTTATTSTKTTTAKTRPEKSSSNVKFLPCAGFKNTIHGLSEKPDLPVLLSVEKMNLPMRIKSFFQRKLFSAYVNENKGKEMIDRLKDTPTMMANYLSVDVLRKLSEKDAKLFEHVESIFMSHPPMMTRTPTQATSKEASSATTTATTSTTSTTAATDSLATDDVKKGTAASKMNGRLYITPYLAFYTHYVKGNQPDKAKMLLEKFPQMKNMLRLGLLCKSLKMEKNEEMLVRLLDLHEDKENPKRVIPIFNNLLLSKCESNDHKSALRVYNDALSRGIVFDDFSVRSLQALQSVLQGHNQPMPWKEGELEKKAELASRKDFSDSDSD
ncbi:hypothetical protein HELRODRAFT_192169 [Helobdella robusta]|uniref:Uncharacterized protein n=1 Tax=Helobdella robusta TaxID=6412 RepID=T1FTN4_HELRO|nr:hypothetical protein HELRODRAFT_192169 [Helobdella robusta]ESO01485.1 hypothetical protein HELRODRAFT_192169 [Helobdella robusta]